MAEEDPPYRRRAPAAPAALRALAEQADEKRLVLPKQAALIDRVGRLELATDTHNRQGCASVLFGTAGVVLTFVGAKHALALIPGVVLVMVASWTYGAGRRETRARRREVLAEHGTRPYPVRDYELWLAADRPLLDIHFKGAVDRDLFVAAVHGIDADIGVDWLTDTRVRVSIPPVRLREPGDGSAQVWGGDRRRLAELLDKIVDPLHLEAGVELVDMGGTLKSLPKG